MTKILQWNNNGLLAHIGELQTIITNHDPTVICIQETRLTPQKPFNSLKNYSIYRNDRDNINIASGGVAILTKNTVHSETLNINSHLEVIAITTYLPQKTSICSIYLPPNSHFTTEDLKDITNQLPKPFIICGDMNAHNTIWGSVHTDPRGKNIEQTYQDETILNTGSPTHFSLAYGTFSAIDLSICNPEFYPELTWETLPDLNGSDHFPIIITYLNGNNTQNTPNQTKKWKLKEANRIEFGNALRTKNHTLTITETDSANTLIQILTDNLKQAASETLQQKKSVKNKNTVPWWNTVCQE